MKENNATLRISLGYYMNDEHVRLQVEDVPSGYRIVDVELTALDFRKLLAGGTPEVEGYLIPARLRDRLGKQVVAESRDFPEDIKGFGAEPSTAQKGYAEQVRKQEGWDDVSLRNSNRGWKFVLFRYEEVG